MSIGWSCRIREVGRFSRNRVVLVFDPKDGWLVVGTWLLDGWGNGRGAFLPWLSRGWKEG